MSETRGINERLAKQFEMKLCESVRNRIDKAVPMTAVVNFRTFNGDAKRLEIETSVFLAPKNLGKDDEENRMATKAPFSLCALVGRAYIHTLVHDTLFELLMGSISSSSHSSRFDGDEIVVWAEFRFQQS